MANRPRPPVPPPPAARFWAAARGFWIGDLRRAAWLLTIGNAVIVLLQLAVQYRLNVWNRDIFDAFEQKDGAGVLTQAVIFLPLAAFAVGLAVFSVYGRMTAQRGWRAWLTDNLTSRWLAGGRYYQLNLISGDHQNPEGRIADDVRLSTDAPVDFGVGLLASLTTAATFVGVLWVVGGTLRLGPPEAPVVIPGYLVIAAVIYSALATVAMIGIARRFIRVSEAKAQAEAEYRYALTRLRENGESIALLGGEREERQGLRESFAVVLLHWRDLCRQHMRSTVVSHNNYVLAPVVPLVLCAPKYLAGTMTLGEMVQAAAAFVQVQSAFNWLVDNYPRFAEWMASVRRVGSLLNALDHLEASARPGSATAIERSEDADPTLRLRELSVTLDDGTVVIDDADVAIERGERVLVLGESGTGKSTLVRAIAGLWPWGHGRILMPQGRKLFLMPQRPYIPLGSLRRVATYPLSAREVADASLRELMELVGLGYLTSRLDETAPWDHVLSGGEKQRVGFVRLLLHRPDIIVMDEATSALDPQSQERMMSLVMERLPEAAVVTIAHRPELEAFHQRKLRFEHRPGGSRLISDEAIAPHNGLAALRYWLKRLFKRQVPAH